jgi:hypothetical protein
MATRSYTIISHYTPPVSDDNAPPPASEESEGDELEQEKIWQTGPLYKSRSADSDIYVSHRAAHPPRFVPAVLSHDTLSLSGQAAAASQPEKSSVNAEKAGLGRWYKSLKSTVDPKVQSPSEPAAFAEPPMFTAPPPLPARLEPTSSKKRKARSQDWFIRNALSTSPSRQSSATASTASSSSSISEILSRAPPPLPGSSDPKFLPPLRTKLGPGNRGYALLAQQGWKEGEGLGSWRTRPIAQSFADSRAEGSGATVGLDSVETNDPRSANSVAHAPAVDEEIREAVVPNVTVNARNIVDLTVTDDDDSIDESSEDILLSFPPPEPSAADLEDAQRGLDPRRTVLLAPLKTYLKSDRLGIGAHRRAPPSSSSSSPRHSQTQRHAQSAAPRGSLPSLKRKPLTDTAQAMYDTRGKERRKREEEHRALMIRLKGGKRGSKGFSAVKREEERRRRDLLAYMNC